MTFQRFLAIFTVAAYATLGMAITNNTWPAWTKYLSLAACFLGTAIHASGGSVTWDSKQTSAAMTAARMVKRTPTMPTSILSIFGLVCILFLLVLMIACASLPKPNGVSVTETDAGVQTCVDWAKQNPRAACKMCGEYLADAGPGL